LISANKEGLISLSGYFALQLIAMGIGRDYYMTLVYDEPYKLIQSWKTKQGLEEKAKSERKLFYKLVTYTILFFLASELSLYCFE